MMPYKDKDKQKLAVKNAKRRSRGFDNGKTETMSYPKKETLEADDVVAIVETVLSNRINVVPDVVLKMIGKLEKRISLLEEKSKGGVDFGKIRKTETEDVTASESGVCSKHGRIKIPGRPACC